MLNRRDVILSTAAMVTCFNRATAVSSPAAAPNRDKSDQGMTTAQACTECATACSVLTGVCVETVAEGMSEFAVLHEISRDCSEICTVAATLLGRQGPLAPAICQACADACDRLADLCSSFNVREAERCEAAARHCAISCRALITHA
jgi:hypothetical protein